MLQQKLQQKIQQKLSPLQIQTIKMLEITSLEMEERIKQELEVNPALEEYSHEELEGDQIEKLKAEEDYNTSENEDFSLDDYRSDEDIPDYSSPKHNNEEFHQNNLLVSGSSLSDALLEQLNLQKLSDREKSLCEFVIGNIDNEGYIRRDAESLVDDYAFQTSLMVEKEEMANAIQIIQSFDPPGIAAFSLQECLLLQLKRKKPTPDIQNALQIITETFDDFSQKRFKQIETKLNLSSQEIKSAMDEIIKLNPKPGNAWENELESNSTQLVPDFIVENEDGNLIVSLNNDNQPSLRINKNFAEMLQNYSDHKEDNKEIRDAALFVKQKLDAAKWFIDAVKQRQETLMRTMQAIVQCQKTFFLEGDETKLKPLILKDISDITGYDVSTISRVSNSKYVQTEFGVFPVKFFFNNSIQNIGGEEVSSNKIKLLINELIENEDKNDPLTDDKLMDALKTKGIDIARRTVAKYREQLGYSVARLRKEIS
jgi:RNA polymerase sigma-54 factor